LNDLLQAVTVGVTEEDLFLSLANLLIRLEKQITEKEKEKLLDYSGGKNLKQITAELLQAFDPDMIDNIAEIERQSIPTTEQIPDIIEKTKQETQVQLIAKGGRGRMWQIFGEEMNEIIEEMNEVLVT